MSVLIYVAETWTFKKSDMNHLCALEMKCFKQLKIKNKEIMKSVNIVQRMMERKLNFFGHICQMIG